MLLLRKSSDVILNGWNAFNHSPIRRRAARTEWPASCFLSSHSMDRGEMTEGSINQRAVLMNRHGAVKTMYSPDPCDLIHEIEVLDAARGYRSAKGDRGDAPAD